MTNFFVFFFFFQLVALFFCVWVFFQYCEKFGRVKKNQATYLTRVNKLVDEYEKITKLKNGFLFTKEKRYDARAKKLRKLEAI